MKTVSDSVTNQDATPAVVLELVGVAHDLRRDIGSPELLVAQPTESVGIHDGLRLAVVSSSDFPQLAECSHGRPESPCESELFSLDKIRVLACVYRLHFTAALRALPKDDVPPNEAAKLDSCVSDFKR